MCMTRSLPPRQFDPPLAGAIQIQLKRMVHRSPVDNPASSIVSWRLRYLRCPMRQVEVLKFGSSVLRTPEELQVAVDEIYRRWRSCSRILAVVSAFEGVTDQLFNEASSLLAADLGEATALRQDH